MDWQKVVLFLVGLLASVLGGWAKWEATAMRRAMEAQAAEIREIKEQETELSIALGKLVQQLELTDGEAKQDATLSTHWCIHTQTWKQLNDLRAEQGLPFVAWDLGRCR